MHHGYWLRSFTLNLTEAQHERVSFQSGGHLSFVHKKILNITSRKLRGGGQMTLQVLIPTVILHLLSVFFFFLLQFLAALLFFLVDGHVF